MPKPPESDSCTANAGAPGPVGVSFHRLRLPTGLTLHYARRCDPQAGPAVGRPLVLLHGLGDSWQSFALVLERLPAHIPVIAPDLRGHGDSDRPPGGYAPADLAADVAALLDALGVRGATVAGHSLGSFAAQALAASRPDLTGRLVLMASAPRADTPGIRAFLDEVRALPDPVPEAFVRAFQDPSGPVPGDFLETVVAQSRKLPAFVWREALAGLAETDHRALLSRIACPTALAWGEGDGVFPRADQQALLGLLPGSVLWTYPAGHALHWERPDAFADDLARFHGA